MGAGFHALKSPAIEGGAFVAVTGRRIVARPFSYAAGTGGTTGCLRPDVSTDSPMIHDVCFGWSEMGSNVSRRSALSSDTSGCSARRPPTDHGVPSLRPPVQCPTLAQRLPAVDALI